MAQPKKVTRNDLAELSTMETLKVAVEVYKKLFIYIKRYRWRFYLGMFFEVLAGMSNAVFVYGFKVIFDIVLVTVQKSKISIRSPSTKKQTLLNPS
jgi:hypothetical protein